MSKPARDAVSLDALGPGMEWRSPLRSDDAGSVAVLSRHAGGRGQSAGAGGSPDHESPRGGDGRARVGRWCLQDADGGRHQLCREPPEEQAAQVRARLEQQDGIARAATGGELAPTPQGGKNVGVMRF